MIYNQSPESEVYGIDPEETIQMGIRDEDYAKLRQILSSNLYSDAEGSLIREIVSNALDANREAGVNTPIIVSLQKENGKFVFSVKDEAMGISKDRMYNIFSKTLASTKMNDSTQLGYYGLGKLSPLAYTDSFIIESIYDNIKSVYLMYKGSEDNMITLLSEDEYFAHNGVTIKITLKEQIHYDLFIKKMKTQLCYFEQIYMDCWYNDINSDYKIIKHNDWKFSELNQDGFIHISLDNVYYPLDYKSLEILPIQIPIALNFSLSDGIMPIPSRESIKMTPHVKELILKRISDVGDYFIQQWNKITPSVDSYDEAKKLHDNLHKILIFKELDKEIYIKIDKKIEKHCTEKMKSIQLSMFPNLNLERLGHVARYFLQEYGSQGSIEGDRYNSKVINSLSHHDTSIIYLKPGETLSKLQIEYVKWSITTDKNGFTGYTYKIARNTRKLHLGKIRSYNQSTDNYYGLLELNKHPKSEWRKIITEYKNLIKSYTDKWITLDQINPTQEFLDWRKSQRISSKRKTLNKETEIKVKFGREACRGVKDFIFESNTLQIKDLKKQKVTFIYVEEDREKELYPYFNFLRWRIVTVNNKTLKLIKEKNLHNWIYLDDLLTKRHRIIEKALTNDILIKFKSNFLNLFSSYNLRAIIKLKDKQLYAKINELDIYITKSKKIEIDKSKYIALTNLYLKNRWFDYSIWHTLQIVYESVEKFNFNEEVYYLHHTKKHYYDFLNIIYNDYKDKKVKTEFNKYIIEGYDTKTKEDQSITN